MGIFDFFKKKQPVQPSKEEKHQTDKNVGAEQIQPEEDIPSSGVDVTANGNDAETFEYQINALIPRYLCLPDATDTKLNFKDELGNPIPPSEMFAKQFEEWKGIRSFADRRGLIFSILDRFLADKMELWQTVERLNDDRQADKALQLASVIEAAPEEKQNPNYWSALARTYLILYRYEDAENCCDKAFRLDKNDIRTKRIYADILHVTNRHDEAHKIYNEILEQKLPKDQRTSMELQDLLGFKGDIMNSPIYAFAWLQNNENVTDEFWDWANEEFYYSPHFRTQYSYLLINKGETMKGFVKFLVLSKEMPWFKEAVVNSLSLIDQLNLKGHFAEDLVRLEKIVSENNWG